MLRLLNIELHKLKYSKSSRNLIFVYFLSLLAIAGISTIKIPFTQGFSLASIGYFDFPIIWHVNTFVASFLKFFPLLIVVSMISNEYSNRTIKQNLIDGLSKKEFILSKFYTVVLFSLISTIFIFILSLILGLIYSSYNEFQIIFSELSYLIAYFFKLTCFLSLGIFFSIIIKRSAFAIAGIIIFFFSEIFSFGYIASKFSEETANNIFYFLPWSSMWNAIKVPFTRKGIAKTLTEQLTNNTTIDYSVEYLNIIVIITWTLIFIYFSYYTLKRRDL